MVFRGIFLVLVFGTGWYAVSEQFVFVGVRAKQ